MTDAGLRLIDTHAHLDDEAFAADVDEVLARAETNGVHRVINIGYRPSVWATTISLADRHPQVSIALGIHPHHADEWSGETEATLRRLIDVRRPVAIGEIGLDYFRNLNPPSVQRRVFLRQIEIALDVDLPIVIHQRGAETDLIDMLRDVPRKLKCILHSFDGSADLAGLAAERDYSIGIGGLMTRAKSEELRTVLAAAPLDLMMLETDSPYLVPSTVKSRRNEPAFVRVVAERLAELKSTTIQQVSERTSLRASRVFGFPASAGHRL